MGLEMGSRSHKACLRGLESDTGMVGACVLLGLHHLCALVPSLWAL